MGVRMGWMVAKSGGQVKKPWMIVYVTSRLSSHLARRCPGYNVHKHIEGSETRISQMYPREMCEVVHESCRTGADRAQDRTETHVLRDVIHHDSPCVSDPDSVSERVHIPVAILSAKRRSAASEEASEPSEGEPIMSSERYSKGRCCWGRGKWSD